MGGEDLCRRLAAVSDWTRLQNLALRHAMLPLLYFQVARTCPDAVPKQTFTQLQLVGRANAERSIRLAATLIGILDHLDAHGVPAVAFKGPLLAEYAYGDVALRNFQDLDLFVAQHHLAAARHLLEARGFRVDHEMPANRQSAREAFHQILRRDSVTVELHWRTGPSYVLPVFQADELLLHSRPTTLIGRSVATLDSADLLLVLCVHGHAHRWSELELVAALARVLARAEYGDPELVLHQARSRACLRRCLIGVMLAKNLAGATLPHAFEAAIAADGTARHLASSAALFDDASRGGLRRRLRASLWRASALDDRRDAVRLGLLQVFAPRDEDLLQASARGSLPGLAHGLRLRKVVRSAKRRWRSGISRTSSGTRRASGREWDH
jgi:hypothetical protein